MQTSDRRLRRFAVNRGGVLLLGAGATHPVAAKAADGPNPCSAFQRNAGGSWRVLAPVTMDFGGMLYSPMGGRLSPPGPASTASR